MTRRIFQCWGWFSDCIGPQGIQKQEPRTRNRQWKLPWKERRVMIKTGKQPHLTFNITIILVHLSSHSRFITVCFTWNYPRRWDTRCYWWRTQLSNCWIGQLIGIPQYQYLRCSTGNCELLDPLQIVNIKMQVPKRLRAPEHRRTFLTVKPNLQ